MEEKSFNDGVERAGPGSPSGAQPGSSGNASSSLGSESFPKRDRLLKRFEYLRVQRNGRKQETWSLVILIYPRRDKRCRLGVAVSKKVGKSVFRNRIKRVIREVFRRNRRLFPSSSDIVIIPKRGQKTFTYRALQEELAIFTRRGKK